MPIANGKVPVAVFQAKGDQLARHEDLTWLVKKLGMACIHSEVIMGGHTGAFFMDSESEYFKTSVLNLIDQYNRSDAAFKL